jgi:hypothetical protein
LQRLERN